MILKDQTTSSTSNSTKTKPALLDKYKDDHQKEVDGYERLKTKETNHAQGVGHVLHVLRAASLRADARTEEAAEVVRSLRRACGNTPQSCTIETAY